MKISPGDEQMSSENITSQTSSQKVIANEHHHLKSSYVRCNDNLVLFTINVTVTKPLDFWKFSVVNNNTIFVEARSRVASN